MDLPGIGSCYTGQSESDTVPDADLAATLSPGIHKEIK